MKLSLKKMIKKFNKISYTSQRLTSEFHRIITQVFGSMINKNYKYINISRINLSKDLNFAIIYYTSLDKIFNEEKSLFFLKSQKFFIKKKISFEWDHRKLPNLLFKYDKKLLEIEKITLILQKNQNS